METNEIRVEEEQPTSPLEEEKTTSEGREADETPEGKEPIPYSRFKEVIDEKNEMKESLETLRQDIETLKQQQKPEEEAPIDWKEAEKRTVDKAVATIEEKAKKSAEDDYKQEQRIERSFEQLKAIGREITPDVRKAVLTDMIKTGSDDVLGTYLKIIQATVKTEKTEQQKKEGFVPSSQKGGVAGKTGLTYKERKAMTLDDIVEKASKAK